jgi:hypothetical protein
MQGPPTNGRVRITCGASPPKPICSGANGAPSIVDVPSTGAACDPERGSMPLLIFERSGDASGNKINWSDECP